MEQNLQMIITAGAFLGSIIGTILYTLMKTSTLSANQKTNQTNITSLQTKLDKTTLMAARLYGRNEAQSDLINQLRNDIKKIDGQKDDLARLLMAERTARQEDKKKYETMIEQLNTRVSALEVERTQLQNELALERRKSQAIPTPAGAVA